MQQAQQLLAEASEAPTAEPSLSQQQQNQQRAQAAPVPPQAEGAGAPVLESADADAEEADGDASDGCTICLDQPSTHAFVPCGHRVVCGTCAQTYEEHRASMRCPVCAHVWDKLVELPAGFRVF